MLKLQLEQPTPGDWASTCLKVKLTLDEIRTVPKQRIIEVALSYILEKQGTKGSEIKHEYLEMAEYLHPFNNHLTIEEKCEMFEVKNRMTKIPYNLSSNSEKKCFKCQVLPQRVIVGLIGWWLKNNKIPICQVLPQRVMWAL